MLAIHPQCLDGYNLFHEGVQVLADVEQQGIPIDMNYCEEQYRILDRKIKRAKKKIEKRKEVKHWKFKYGENFSLQSGDQLAYILFDYLKHEPKILTDSGKPSTSQAALEQIEAPIVEMLTDLGRITKARNTYIKNFMLEQVDGTLHPFFNLHIPRTFRSSSSAINFQNIPTRIEEIKKLVRQAIVPLPGYMIVEIDFSGVEVCISACYNKDPNLIDDIINPEKDMHRDMAMKCYKLSLDQVNKKTRYNGKNKFVFPQFYGDYFASCAQALWDAIHIQKLETAQGVPLKRHLRQEGITNYARFESHIQDVENYFWGKRYGVYAQWKEEHWETYQQNGYVDLKTGFRCSGVMSRNEAINYPIQGAAFHCLLWCLIKLHKWMKQSNKKSKIIGQIHDSIVLMMHPSELNTILRRAYYIMEHEIRDKWPWIIIPLSVETEASPVDGSWYLKKEITKQDIACSCGSKWFYENKTDTERRLDCPVCKEIYRQAA